MDRRPRRSISPAIAFRLHLRGSSGFVQTGRDGPGGRGRKKAFAFAPGTSRRQVRYGGRNPRSGFTAPQAPTTVKNARREGVAGRVRVEPRHGSIRGPFRRNLDRSVSGSECGSDCGGVRLLGGRMVSGASRPCEGAASVQERFVGPSSDSGFIARPFGRAWARRLDAETALDDASTGTVGSQEGRESAADAE